jgi:hypothetical protein
MNNTYNSRKPNGRLRSPNPKDGSIKPCSTGCMGTNNNPRTNTAVLKDAGYQFKTDTYKPRQYVQSDRGWTRM